MPEYDVTITRRTEQEAVVTVTARDEDGATTKVEQMDLAKINKLMAEQERTWDEVVDEIEVSEAVEF